MIIKMLIFDMPIRYLHTKVSVLGGTVLCTLPNLNDDELIATAVLAIFGATVSFVCSVLLKLYYKRSKWHRLMKKYKKSKRRK
ncbi:hypothetical protein CA2559_11628 [Croceibacter atlanticus HTCC2559]|uniref:Uncharacterized protein n=1 Tax=Croceibacter atlanticus (strain ATCC BAA-628 / JCM 21780 / CIP 108009 / IAM 15332 / KCTC 12090 / HTCC2559) TaxID=216432 RepID=A3UA48_CROAH|nr:hypothetical protein CA2559_11628 [Croceibacter atlanticus HTCC2559]